MKKLYTVSEIESLLRNNGVPNKLLPFVVAQVRHETNDFQDHKLYDHNNGSGITFINNSKLQKNASKGNILPETKNSSRPVYYARYATLNDWARDYIRIINKGPNYPLKAQTFADYVSRLKANNYFTDTLGNYARGLAKYLKGVSAKVPDATIPIIFAVVALLLISRKK